MLKYSGQFRTINLSATQEIKINSKNEAILMSTFGFSSLYRNIPHHKLKLEMGELIGLCFSGDVKEFIWITKYGTIWTDNKKDIDLFQ